ncbi:MULTISPECIES: tetratricopeptide repeat protein [unclassified Myroides]|uniref:tetratricopeptide repeat protein n=1 Tax=unclassified Myroides TaxID=2642485 RepID=UPI003D2F527C
MRYNNPIQQRVEEFELNYLETKYTHTYTYLIFRTAQDDWEMIDAFYDYMLGVDNEIEDVVVVFKSPLQHVQNYSEALVEELFMSTFLWNYAEKPKEIEDNFIHWEMDLSATSEKNVAALFVANINAFCEVVEFEEDSDLVCVLDYQNEEEQYILHWLKDLAKLELHPKVRLVLSDTIEDPIFDELTYFTPNSIHFLVHRFELAQAIKEVAAMGDPDAPDTQYRYHLVQLYEGVNKQQEKEIEKHATSCLAIANQQKEKDANWLLQLVSVYCALATAAFGKKEFKKAIVQMDEALAILQEGLGKLAAELLDPLFGQVYLFRGNLFLMIKSYPKAIADFQKGETYYEQQQNHLMRVEAFRLLAMAATKNGDHQLRYEALDKGIRLGVHLTESLALASTYTLLAKDVLDSRYTEYISDRELDCLVEPLLGKQWRTKTKNVKNSIANKDIK